MTHGVSSGQNDFLEIADSNMSKNSCCAKEMKTRAENKIKKFFWFIVYCLLFIVYGLWFIVYSLMFIVYCLWNAVVRIKVLQSLN